MTKWIYSGMATALNQAGRQNTHHLKEQTGRQTDIAPKKVRILLRVIAGSVSDCPKIVTQSWAVGTDNNLSTLSLLYYADSEIIVSQQQIWALEPWVLFLPLTSKWPANWRLSEKVKLDQLKHGWVYLKTSRYRHTGSQVQYPVVACITLPQAVTMKGENCSFLSENRGKAMSGRIREREG